ncbi:unnamed protein product [Thelazia callipaeda]|uniref:RING-type domain-containing protein n=1 Tax=Thelazia callipaeda TaxID=103827 RepID=A0A0N5D2J9_THECL|nr:unnamed protein product [Thelazia callipaeda]
MFMHSHFIETSTVPVTSAETSRKRTADEEEPADVPSASRRRRIASTDTSSYIGPTFPNCCANGVMEQAYVIPSSPSYGPVTIPNAQATMAPIFAPQVIAPQIHAQLTAVPSRSIVHNMTPIALHLHAPPPITSNFAYFLPHTAHMIQPLMGLRLPTAQFVTQDIPLAEQGFFPPLMGDIPEEYSGIQRPLDDFPVIPTPQPLAVNASRNWDNQYHLFPGFSYFPRPVNAYMNPFSSRGRGAQNQSAQIGIDHVPAVLGGNQIGNPVSSIAPNVAASAETGVQSNSGRMWTARNHNTLPMVDGPVAIPTLSAHWIPQPNLLPRRDETDDDLASSSSTERTDISRLDTEFRAWEAAVLQIFDRMAPQINASRMPPRGISRSEIDKLGSFRLSDTTLVKEKLCVICQCDFEKRDLIRELPCSHHFHLKCVDKWLRSNRSCPICRKNAVPDETNMNLEALAVASRYSPTVSQFARSVEDGVSDIDLLTAVSGNSATGTGRPAVQVITQAGTTPDQEDDSSIPDLQF